MQDNQGGFDPRSLDPMFLAKLIGYETLKARNIVCNIKVSYVLLSKPFFQFSGKRMAVEMMKLLDCETIPISLSLNVSSIS